MQSRSTVVIDANVLAVANRLAEHVNEDCIRLCASRLANVRRAERVALDQDNVIWSQYARQCSYRGSPGLGSEFFRWLHQRRWDPRYCEAVALRRRGDDPDADFESFPADDALSGFDRDDRVFIAVARASRQAPPVLNATDTRWRPHLAALARHGVVVEILCPQHWPTLGDEP